MSKIYTLGVDIGSTSSKCAIMSDGKNVESSHIVSMGAGTEGVELVIKEALDDLGLSLDDIAAIVSTGYGRNSYKNADKTMSELSCHAKGGNYIFGNIKTIIDIGGQDSKVIRLDDNGQMQNFVMNDKCAAGTGRFLEVMSKVLHVELDDFGEYDDKATDRAPISSTCAVFAESEVISQLAQGQDVKNIIKGIHQSVASRVAGQAKRIGVVPKVAMTGGVSRNMGVVRALERELDTEIVVSDNSQLAGAFGAGIFAYEYYLKNKKGE